MDETVLEAVVVVVVGWSNCCCGCSVGSGDASRLDCDCAIDS